MAKMNRRKFIKSNVAAATALSLSSALHADTGNAGDVKVGFAKTDISPCIKSQTKFRKPLEAICAAIETADSTVAIIALDFIEMPPQDCKGIQRQVSALTKIPADNILIHTTHTHSAPWGERETGQQIANLPETLAAAVTAARENVRPARIRTAQKDVGKTLSVYRRGDAGPELGIQTFWFGYTFRDNDDRPDASALVNEMKSRWLRKKPDYTPAPEPVWFDRDVDSLVQAIAFEDLEGKALGSIVRFSAHPHLTCACTEWLYDPDYPAIVRDVVENKLKAPVMFLSGTCGNLVPKEKVKYVIDWDKVPPYPYMGPSSAFDPADDNELLAETARIGAAVAEAALNALAGADAQDISNCRFHTKNFAVPIDPNLPTSQQEVDRIRQVLVAEYECCLRRNNPIRELRSIANRLNWLDWAIPFSMNMLSDEERTTCRKNLPLSVLALNSIAMIFMHSEISAETTFALRKHHTGFNIFSVGLTGGAIGYIPTAEMIDEGGYEGRATIIARDAEAKLRSDIAELLALV